MTSTVAQGAGRMVSVPPAGPRAACPAVARPGCRPRCGAGPGCGPRLTLTPPLAWFLVIYLASLVVMLVTAFWSVNPFTNTLVHTWTLSNFRSCSPAPT